MNLVSRRKFVFTCSVSAAATLSGCFVERHMPWYKAPPKPVPQSDATTVKCVYAETGIRLTADPNADFWKGALPVFMEKDRYGNPLPDFRTAIATRWTERNLYVLFVCPYDELHLHDQPKTGTKTWQLWKWDVAEMFIGWDFDKIQAYKEFEMSPQGEWLDLDIDLSSPTRGQGPAWSSDFDVDAHIDRDKKIWFGAMKIPFAAILPAGVNGAKTGDKFRVNFFRSQGTTKKEHLLAWQPPMTDTFHTPEKFGTMVLVGGNTPHED
jgi:cellulose/xylan binding protein with CBM9 domain